MEVPKEEEVIGIQHPLENHLILDLVFGYFQTLAKFKDWKRIRTVCKTWYFQTLGEWRTIAVLNLKFGPTLHQNQPRHGVSMSEFLTLIENDNSCYYQFSEIPFQQYKLQNLVLDMSILKKQSIFWTLFGSNIRHLSLDQVDIRTFTNTINEVMEFLVNLIPNLESFAVSNVHIGRKRISQPSGFTVVHPHVKTLSISNCFSFGFANFPNLQEVTLNSCGSEDMANLVESNLPVMQAGSTNSSIQRLRLVNCCLDEQSLFLQFTALKHLSVSTDKDIRFYMNNVFLSLFIRIHSETLESIELFGSLKKLSLGSYYIIDDALPKLTELRVWGNVLSDLRFIRYTPNLKVFHVDIYGFEKSEEMKEKLSTGSLVKLEYPARPNLIAITNGYVGGEQLQWQHLHYFQMNYELSTKSLRTLAKWMPNLKTFKTVLNKDTLAVVCEKWPNLEHLECLFGSSILNENITGTETSKNALIDMEYLTTFKLHTECNKSLLSDNSVARGFLRVPKLTNLRICVSSEFSQDAEMLLKRGICNVQVCRNYSSNSLHINWQCCRDREYRDFIFTRAQEPPRPR